MPTRAATWPSGIRLVWRDLTWGQYRKVQSRLGPPADKALEVYQLCKIEGLDADQVPAGIMMWLYQYEMETSPFSGTFKSISGPLEAKRQQVTGTYLHCAQAFIASVFKIPFEVMDDWDSETFLTRIAQAEFVSGVPLNPVDPKTTNLSQKNNVKKTKKPLTSTQQLAIERKQNDQPNSRSTRTISRSPQR